MAVATQAKPKTAAVGYGRPHRDARKALKPFVESGQARCAKCGERIAPGEEWDLGHSDDRRGYNGPEHARCNRATSVRRPWWLLATPAEMEKPERPGLEQADPRWRVPWLRGLRTPPKDATWPRFMTVPHPAAVGSLGREFARFAEQRSGRELRWWQRLVAARLLEVDDRDELVWETLVLSLARQLGKSWLLRELLLWRVHQGERFGEPQDVLHTGKDLAVCKEVQRPARIWAKARQGTYKVREVNGQEEIELLADGGRWMLRAKEAVYGYSVSCAAADEAWKVKASSIDEGLTPTMVERAQPQLLLISTAHRLSTSLMLGRRQVALEQLETGLGDLLIEWSAPRVAALDDVRGWRLASPHWTPKRQRLIQAKLDALRAGEIDDPEEPDPEESFRAQWLNQWPRRLQSPAGPTEPLLPAGLWAELTLERPAAAGPLFVAVEDDYGTGAAVAAAARLDDERIEVDGWTCPDWDSAIDDVRELAEAHRIRQLLVGASLLNRVPPGTSPAPRPAGAAETRVGLPLLRDLAVGRMVAHDQTTAELDEAVATALVREAPSGLRLEPTGSPHLVKALVWAVHAAHRPAPMPRVH